MRMEPEMDLALAHVMAMMIGRGSAARDYY